MAQQDNLDLRLSIETDASVRQSVQELERVEAGYDAITDRINQADAAARAYFGRLRQEARDAQQDVERLTTLLEEQRKKNLQLQEQQNRPGTPEDRTRDQGEVGFNIAGGLLSSAGEALGSGAVSAAGEFVGIFDELNQQFIQAGQSSSKLGSILGKAGVFGAALVGVIGLSVAVADAITGFSEAMKELGSIFNSEVEARRRVNAQLSQLTTEQIYIQQEAIDIQIQAQEKLLADLQDAVDEIPPFLGVFFQDVTKQFEQQKSLVQGLEAEYDSLEAALDSSVVAANDMREAEEELAEKRREAEAEAAQSLLDEASNTAEYNKFKAESVGLTRDEIEAKKEELAVRRQLLQDELNVLKRSGNQNEAVQDRVEALTGELGRLDDKLEVLNNTTAKASEETEKLERSVSKRGFLLKGGGGRGFAQAEPAINKALQDVYNEFAKRAFESQEGLSLALMDVNKELSRSFEDLRIEQKRDIDDAIRTGDILGIRDITRNAQRQAEDLNRNAARDRLDIEQDYNFRIIELARERRDAVLEAERQITESTKRAARAVGGILLPSGGAGISFGRAPRT